MANEAKAGPKASPKSKGPQLPVVLSANNLLVGDVVFLSADGWTRGVIGVGSSVLGSEA